VQDVSTPKSRSKARTSLKGRAIVLATHPVARELVDGLFASDSFLASVTAKTPILAGKSLLLETRLAGRH
jgi:hypothetical protein